MGRAEVNGVQSRRLTGRPARDGLLRVGGATGVEVTLTPAEVPAGYRREYERRLHLRDGRTVAVRPVIAADAPLLA
jgi:hypothetical protein